VNTIQKGNNMRLNKILGLVTVMAMVVLMSASAVSASVDVSIGSATDVDPDAATTVEIIAHNVTELGLFGIKFDYDASVVSVTGVQNDPAIPDSFGISDVADDGSLSLVTSGLSKPSLTGAEVLLVTVTLKAVGDAGDECDLNITVVKLEQTDGTAIDATDVDGTFGIAGGSATLPVSISIGSATDVDLDAATTVEIIAHNVTELGLFGIKFDYDASVVSVTGVQNDPAIPDSFGISDVADDGSLSLVTSGLSKPSLTGAEVLLVTVTLKAVGDAGDECDLNITVVKLEQTDGTAIDATDVDGTFTISGGAEDTTPPVITNVVCNTPTTDSVNITWTTDEVGDSLVKYGTETGVYTDNESYITMVTSHSIMLTGLVANTTYYFVVNSIDASGNAGDGSEFSFTTATISDTTAPVISNVENTDLTTNSVTISWDTDEDSDSVVKYGTTPGVYTDNESDTSLVSSHSISLAGLSADTTYYYMVYSTDASGNAGDGSEFSFTTATISDTTAPVISNVENTDLTTDSVTISWDTDEDSDSVVKYGTTPGVYTDNESDTSLVSSHSISLTGLSAETTYYYMVYSTDASGNAGEGSEYNFTIAAISENTTIILIVDAIAAPNGYAFTSVMVNNVAGLGSGNVNVTFDPSVIQVIDVTSGDGNALIVQDWNVDNTAGSLEIAAWDANNPHNGDVVFAHVTLHSVGDHLSSATLAISSADLINYDTLEPITHTVATGTFDTIAPVVIIENVEAASGEFTAALVIVNNASNLGSGSITVTYNPSVVHVTNVTSGDGNALVIQDWNADNTAGSVTIAAWDADESLNGDVVFAHVTFHAVGEFQDSTPLAISSSELIDYTSYGIIGHSVTNGTFSIIDNEPPVITAAIATLDVILSDNGRPRVPGTNVTVLNATVLDSESGVVNVTIDLSPIGGSDDQVMERIAGTDVWTVTTTATDGINLTHELVVTATDGADNTNTSVIGLTVLLRGDVVRDGELNSADALYLAKYMVGKEPMPSLLVSDMSPAQGDGKITSADALYLAKYLVGKEAAP